MQKSEVSASLKISSFSYETERLGARPFHAVFMVFMLLHVFMCFGFVMVVCGDAEPRLLRLKLLVLLPESSWIKDEPLHADCRCDLACQAKPTRLSPTPPGPIQDVFIPKKEKDVSNPKKELRPLYRSRENAAYPHSLHLRAKRDSVGGFIPGSRA